MLLEILIAIFLLTLCLSPLLQAPLLAYKTEIQTLKAIQKNALATTSFAEVKLLLLNKEISFDKLPLPGQTSSPISLSPYELEIPGFSPIKVNRSFTLTCPKKGHNVTNSEDLYKMLVVEIFFEPSEKSSERYRFKTIVKKAAVKT